MLPYTVLRGCQGAEGRSGPGGSQLGAAGAMCSRHVGAALPCALPCAH
jgi:hypothetical protein